MPIKFLSNFKTASGRKFLLYMPLEKLIRACPYPNMRVAILKLLGAELGKDVVIHDTIFQNVYVNGFRNLKMGDKATIQAGGLIDLASPVIIHELVTISAAVKILTHSNPGKKMGKPLAEIFPPVYKQVEIKRGAWIGAGALLMPGVSIGEMSVVGAGSVVTGDVLPWTIVAGVPAKTIKKIEVPEDKQNLITENIDGKKG